MNDLLSRSWTWLITAGIKIPFIIAGAFVLIRLLFILINRLRKLPHDGDPNLRIEREKRATTLVSILKQVTVLAISGIAFMMILREFKVDIAPIIAGAGVLGLAVGFGAQSLVKDVISGFFILLENQFDVGDVIEGAGVSGGVERMHLRYTQLRDQQGRVHFIPNGEFRVVSNLTRGWSQAVVDVSISYREDVDRVTAVLTAVGEGMRAEPAFGRDMMQPLQILGVESFGDSSINIRVLLKTTPGRQFDVAREFRKRLKKRFDETGIEIPFPHRVIYTGVAQGLPATRTKNIEEG